MSKFNKPQFPFEKIGEVFICRDSANVVILTDNNGEKRRRFLVTSEFVELMDPTQQCFQLGMDKIVERLKNQDAHGDRKDGSPCDCGDGIVK